MTLWELGAGISATISGYKAELEESYHTRLVELGFAMNEQIQCVLAPTLGAPKLYRVDNTIYSLDDSIARQIEVTRV